MLILSTAKHILAQTQTKKVVLYLAVPPISINCTWVLLPEKWLNPLLVDLLEDV